MKPLEWGPSIWYLIHSIAYYCDEKDFKNNNNFFFLFYNSLKKLIPCPICRKHLNKLMNKKNINTCKSNEDLINWTIRKHNEVNNRLKKKNLNRNDANKIYKNIDLNKVIKAVDIIMFNIQLKVPISEYIIFMNTLKKIFPEKIFRTKLALAIDNKKIKVKLKNQNDIIKWYLNIGNYIRTH